MIYFPLGMLFGLVVGFIVGEHIGGNRAIKGGYTAPPGLRPSPPTSRGIQRVYKCPVCGIDDPYAHIRCMRAGCPDGRDPR